VSQSITPLFGIDNVCKQSGDNNLSMHAYHKLIAEFPKNSTLLDMMGQFQFNVAKYDSALYYIEQSNKYGNRPVSENWARIGWYKLFVKDFGGAIDADNKALNFKQTDENVRIMTEINLAHAYFLSKEYNKAEQIYTEYKNKLWEDRIIKDVIAEDFEAFIAAGLTDKELGNEMDRLKTSLKNQ
jgi:Tfp pilus assembly protein PilF